MKNEKWFKDILAEVKFGDGFPMARFYYHPLYKVGVGKDTDLDYTFGRNRKIPWKNLRKFKYFSFEAPFPTDSVVFFQPERQRLIISSKKEGKVLKISTSSGQLALLKGEIKELTFQNMSEFSPHSVKLLEYGPNWIMTSFCSNIDSVHGMFLLDLQKLVMPAMNKFYRAHGVEKLGVTEWAREARTRAEGHPHIEIISKVISKIEEHSDSVLLKGQLHFDLHHGNVLKAGDRLIIIDWEVSHQGLLLVDYFDFYRRLLRADKQELKNFLLYLTNKSSSSVTYSNFLQGFKEWSFKLGIDITDDTYRFLPMLYSVERALIYWEKWREDRFTDKKGVEFAIANAIKEI